jgi:hypothetical protein
VNHNLVAARIANDDETADGRIRGFHGKFHAMRFQPRNFSFKVVHFKRDARSLIRRLPDLAVTADAKRAFADFVFDSVISFLAFAVSHINCALHD